MITASTFRDNKGVWGAYRKYKNGHSKQGLTEEDQKRLQRKYVRQFGTTILDSNEDRKTCYEKAKDSSKVFPFPIYTAYPEVMHSTNAYE